ncbi:MAG: Crp/Fnr family transcriptional regulator [Candidatus Cybelea sp.]
MSRPNRVLSRLSEESHGALSGALQPVTFADGEVLYEAGSRIERVYFPLSAVVSILQVMEEGAAAEVGMVGCEGIAGLDALLRDGTAAARHVCQVPGTALVTPAATLKNAAKQDQGLLDALLYYAGGYCAMLAQLIACNRLHRVEQRCARWLLMTVDRIGRLEFPMTQERLSMMLGAQRPTVTAVITSLRDAGCLENSRGQIRITNRKCLEYFACECYRLCAGYFDL